ncbi:MAG: hypothetical protein B7Y59_02430 [Burkholderiales bacterium 35-55-47]|nr:MAG: hypothetical protein B7Y59_02430 [Burkholderiales bacterium 35-55-47]
MQKSLLPDFRVQTQRLMQLGCLVKRSQGGERRTAPLGGHERNKAPKMREPSNAKEEKDAT